MSDKALLEMAAKAIGLQYDEERSRPHPENRTWWGLWIKYDREPHEFDRRYWNPLRDDGDAMRLAVTLAKDGRVICLSIGADKSGCEFNFVESSGNPEAATRRSIVIAAAKIGELKS